MIMILSQIVLLISAITDHNLLVMTNSNIVKASNIINKQTIETAQQRYCIHTHTHDRLIQVKLVDIAG